MGRPKKLTPTIEKAPLRLPSSVDVLPEFQLGWDFFMEKFNRLAHTFGYAKVETPLVEDARLFKFWEQGITGQLFFYTDAKGNRLAVKPDNLFSLVRIYLEHKFFEREKVCKWFYSSPVAFFFGEELRQTTEFGFQTFGDITPIADSQLINLVFKLFQEAGFANLTLQINNIGCLECQPPYQEVLKNYLKEKKYDLCDNCIEALETNPLKTLACNNLSCSAAVAEGPVLVDYLCDNCRRHFIAVLEGLDELGIIYNLNQKIIGKPWSRRTVFEIRFHTGQADLILGSGGHADDLTQSLGGPQTLSLGFSGFIDIVLNGFEKSNIKFASKHKVDVFLVPLGDLASKKTLRLFTELWNHDIVASEFIGQVSIKNQLKLAESNKVSIALIIGQKEARDGTVILRDVRSGMQELFTADRIIEEVKKRLGK